MSNYTVSEIIIIQFFCFVVVLNAPSWYHFIITQFQSFLAKVNENRVELKKFYQFIEIIRKMILNLLKKNIFHTSNSYLD